ncbi:MAG TPA: amidohydrolase family protein [Gemmatimonadaceae bacterium]
MRWIASLVLVAAVAGSVRAQTTYDLVIANGRVMDPASGLDAVRHVGITGRKIATISATPLKGKRVIDAKNNVVAPGFIDLHEHGQNEEAYRMMVRDGVTTALELELGVADVPKFYADRASGQIVNYGASVGHIPARMQVLRDPSTARFPAGVGGSGKATEAQIAQMEAILRKGLADGAVAVGLGSAYTPGASMDEIQRMFKVAAQGNASAHIHMRNGVAGLDSTIAAAKVAGVKLHIVHVNSVGNTALPTFLAHIKAARDRSQDVTTEAYPYGAGMTEIQSALFDDWKTWPDVKFQQYQLVSTGERLTRKTFEEARKNGGTVIIHERSEAQTREAIVSPLTIIASDGYIESGRGHPRTSGTYAKVLGKYVREEKALSLMDALRKMTIMPAQRLEARVPMMTSKGRIKVGADADLTIFDPAAVIDKATYEDATIPSAGIPFVIVNGQVVVDSGKVTAARPGRGVRAPGR